MTWRSLAKKTEFQRVYEDGAKQVGRFLVVYLLSADNNAQAVVASRKVGGAVQRNRAKRLLREALQAQHKSGGISNRERFFPELEGLEPSPDGKEGLWVVLVARHRILSAKSPEVQVELNNLLNQWGPLVR